MCQNRDGRAVAGGLPRLSGSRIGHCHGRAWVTAVARVPPPAQELARATGTAPKTGGAQVWVCWLPSEERTPANALRKRSLTGALARDAGQWHLAGPPRESTASQGVGTSAFFLSSVLGGVVLRTRKRDVAAPPPPPGSAPQAQALLAVSCPPASEGGPCAESASHQSSQNLHDPPAPPARHRAAHRPGHLGSQGAAAKSRANAPGAAAGPRGTRGDRKHMAR